MQRLNTAYGDILGKVIDAAAEAQDAGAEYLRLRDVSALPEPDPEQQEGQPYFYVKPFCISCEVCTEAAPANFAVNQTQILEDPEAKNQAVVFRQPETGVETAQCVEALKLCPVFAIAREARKRSRD